VIRFVATGALGVLLLSTLLASPLLAQTVQTLPAGYLTQDGNNSNGAPWSVSSPGFRSLYIYDSSHFPQGLGALRIQRLRWRAHLLKPTWLGGTHAGVTVALSTAPHDYQGAVATFDNNHGPDKTTVFQGTVTVTPSTHPNGRWMVDLQLSAPFDYDPAKGDLTLDITRTGVANGDFAFVDHVYDTVGRWWTKSTRVFNNSTGTSPTGTVGVFAAIVEVSYVPVVGLQAGFDATPLSGASPLRVQFTDTSRSSDPGGITSWEWDFDGDKQVDSTLQNPQWSFYGTGWDVKHSVTLTVRDASHPAATLTKKDWITVNPFPVASATEFGAGSTVPTVSGPIGMPGYVAAVNSPRMRGYYFKAPVPLAITGFEVANGFSRSKQTIGFYVLDSEPLITAKAQPGQRRFWQVGVPANQLVSTGSPLQVKKDEWCVVLGACHDGSTTSVSNSLGNGPFLTTVIGRPTLLRRMEGESQLIAKFGFGDLSPYQGGFLGLVYIHLAGNNVAPSLMAESAPVLGQSASVFFNPIVNRGQASLLFLSPARLPAAVGTPFGGLLVDPRFLAIWPGPAAGGRLTLPIPGDIGFAGIQLYFQGALLGPASNFYGMSNGVEWRIGKP
jgi:PKD repeat protein